MTAPEWIEAFCEQIGIEAPDDATTGQILRLASVAAHASERTAAPVESSSSFAIAENPLTDQYRNTGWVAATEITARSRCYLTNESNC